MSFVQLFKVRAKDISVPRSFSHLIFWFGLIRCGFTWTRTHVEGALPIWRRERAFKRKLQFV